MSTTTIDLSAATVEELLKLVAAADRSAFEALHQRLRGRVDAIAWSLLRNADLAQEVAQEVFLQIWQHADRYNPARGTALGWIHGLTRGRAIDRIRAVHAARVRDHQWADEAAISRPPVEHVDELVLARIESVRLHQALQCLTPHQRQAIVLSFFGARTHQQIAETLHCPLGTVKTRIRDGLLRLRAQLADHHPARQPTGAVSPSPARRDGSLNRQAA